MPATPPDEVVRVVAHVSGRVQGVGFRFWTLHRASLLGVAGGATNLADGRVEVVMEGAPAAVDAMVADLEHGPPAGRVDRVETRREQPVGSVGFDIR